MAKNRNTNLSVLSGNLVADPETRATKTEGQSVTQMRLAVNNGESKDGREYPVTFIDVVAWNGMGENAAKYLSKGRYIVVTGRIDYREWEADDGSKRSKHQITASQIEFGPGGQRIEGDAPASTDDIPF